MRHSALICSILAMVPLSAQTTALSVRNLSVEGERQQVSFDVVNNSSKAVRNWTMTVHSKKQGLTGGVTGTHDANLLMDGCSGSGTVTLAPGASHHCAGSLYSGEQAKVLSAEVIFTSVLFDDGSAEGDLSLLDELARQRASRMRALEFWIGRLSPALSASTPREQLQTMQQALSAPDSEIPEDLRYDPKAMQQRRTLLSQVTYSLQMLDTPQMRNPQAQATGTVMSLRQQLELMRAQPDPFPPRRGANLGVPVGDPLQGWKAVARTAALRLVAVREGERLKLTTLVLQNETKKGISAVSVSYGDTSHGNRQGQTEECFGSDTPVCASPGGSISLRLSAPGSRTLNIDAVVFEDGSGDGEQSEVDAIQYSRLGRMYETERIRGILEAADANFSTIRSQIGGLPQSPEEALAGLAGVSLPGVTLDRVRQAGSRSLASFFSGARNARESAVFRMSEYERRGGSPVGGLAELLRELQNLSQQYRAYCRKLYEAKK